MLFSPESHTTLLRSSGKLQAPAYSFLVSTSCARLRPNILRASDHAAPPLLGRHPLQPLDGRSEPIEGQQHPLSSLDNRGRYERVLVLLRQAEGHGGGSTSHILRTTPSTSSSPSRNPSSGGGSSSSSSTIIAPPPRVALGSSSVSTDESSAAPQQQQQQQQHAPPNGSTAASAKDLSASAAVAAAAASAATHMVKEKDMRIAALERELGIMESEFTRELDKLSQNESETAAFWQAKHSALNQQFLRADTELRLLRAEVELREAERDELRAGWDSMRRDLATRDDEVRQLRAQVRGLKEWVSTSTRSDGQTSDEVFGDSMARLGNGLQNWVIVNFRRSRLGGSVPNRPPPCQASCCCLCSPPRLRPRRSVAGQQRCQGGARPAGAHVRSARTYGQGAPITGRRLEAAGGSGV